MCVRILDFVFIQNLILREIFLNLVVFYGFLTDIL